MPNQLTNNNNYLNDLSADCKNCFGLCCVALPYAKSADFAFDKDAGTSCPNLQSNYHCRIHRDLREKGFKGCAAYECFGAGQKVSQITYDGNDWRSNPALAKEMFEVFPIMQQLHEMLYYLNEALHLEEAQAILKDLEIVIEKTEYLTNLSPDSILELNISAHRAIVNDLLLRTSELVRAKASFEKNKNQPRQNKVGKRSNFIGANLRRTDLRGANLRGALLIAADLRESDMGMADFIGADLRDADLRGANLVGSIFLTQAQINSAKGDKNTKLPPSLRIPDHWLKS